VTIHVGKDDSEIKRRTGKSQRLEHGDQEDIQAVALHPAFVSFSLSPILSEIISKRSFALEHDLLKLLQTLLSNREIISNIDESARFKEALGRR